MEPTEVISIDLWISSRGAPRGQLATSGDISYHLYLRGDETIDWSGMLPNIKCTRVLLTTKNYPTQNINSAEVERLLYR